MERIASCAEFAFQTPTPLGASAIVRKAFPELRPALFESATDVDVRMIRCLLILNSIWIGCMSGEKAGGKMGVEKVAAEAHDDEGLWRRIGIATQPEGINAADGTRQTVV